MCRTSWWILLERWVNEEREREREGERDAKRGASGVISWLDVI